MEKEKVKVTQQEKQKNNITGLARGKRMNDTYMKKEACICAKCNNRQWK